MMKTLFLFMGLLTSTLAVSAESCPLLQHKELLSIVCNELKTAPSREMIFLVHAIIEKESGYESNSSRTEPDGRQSLGLMHVIDKTAAEMGLQNTDELYNPRVGIKYGVKYLLKKKTIIEAQIADLKSNPNSKYNKLILKHNLSEMMASSYNAGSVRFRADGKLYCNRENIGNGQFLSYSEAVMNLVESYTESCQRIPTADLCR
jgi:hypothetical protein